MTQHTELLEQAYRYQDSWETDKLTNLLTDDAIWHVPGDNILSGTYRGSQEIVDLLNQLRDVTDGDFSLTIDKIESNDEFVVSFATTNASRMGNELTQPTMHIASIRDGKISEFWIHNYDQAEVDSFFSKAKEMQA